MCATILLKKKQSEKDILGNFLYRYSYAPFVKWISAREPKYVSAEIENEKQTQPLAY